MSRILTCLILRGLYGDASDFYDYMLHLVQPGDSCSWHWSEAMDVARLTADARDAEPCIGHGESHDRRRASDGSFYTRAQFMLHAMDAWSKAEVEADGAHYSWPPAVPEGGSDALLHGRCGDYDAPEDATENIEVTITRCELDPFRMGVRFEDSGGLTVESCDELAGIRPGDWLVQVGDVEVGSTVELRHLLEQRRLDGYFSLELVFARQR